MDPAAVRAGAPDAIILQGDHFRFTPGEERGSASVQSRRLLWCRAGRGTVTVDGVRFALAPEDFLFMPWGHRVRYQADPRRGFAVGSIHLAPLHERGVDVRFYDIPQEAGAWPRPGRRDAPLPGLPAGGTGAGSFAHHPPLGQLAEYVVATFAREPDETGQRALAHLLLAELATALAAQRAAPSPAMGKAIAALDRAGDRLPLAELAAALGTSPSSAIRLFKRETGLTPRRFQMERRIQRARALLTGTDLPIQAVGAAVGMPQAHYFSRLFRALAGMSPRQCRERSRFV